jgi:hypothetical protein
MLRRWEPLDYLGSRAGFNPLEKIKTGFFQLVMEKNIIETPYEIFNSDKSDKSTIDKYKASLTYFTHA